MKLLILFGIIAAACAAEKQEWDRHTVNLDVITQQIDVVSSDVDHLVTLRQCPSSIYCIETNRIEILEMTCVTNSTDTDPDYLNFIGKSSKTGEVREKKVSVCEHIEEAYIIEFENFEADEVLIQPVGKAWTKGEVSAKVNIVAEIQGQENSEMLDRNFRLIRNEIIYLEIFVRNMFLFTSTLTVLIVALLLAYFTMKLNKMFIKLVSISRHNTANNATALPPTYYDIDLSNNQPDYQKSRF